MDEHAQEHLRARRERWLSQLGPHGRAVVENAEPLTAERRALVVGLLSAAASAATPKRPAA